MLSFCFYTRKCSVLFPSNKYQIKVYFPFLPPFPEWTSLFSSVRDAHTCPRGLGFLSESGGWKTAAGGAGPLCGLRRRAACFLFRLSFGPQLLDPMLLLLGKMYTLGIKIITSTQHRRGAGWREGREDGGGKQDRGTKTNQTKITTLKASTYQNVRP